MSGTTRTMTIENSKIRRWAFWINMAIVIMEIISAGMSFSEHGLGMFRFYTEDSNLLALFASLCCMICSAKDGPSPRWVTYVKFMAATCLTVTFIVVVTVLAPYASGMVGYYYMLLHESMLYHHLLCPILTFIVFVFLEKEPPLPKKALLYALIPTFIYAVITVILNIVGVLDGPYPFLKVREQPVWQSILWVLIIFAVAYLSAWVIRRSRDRKNTLKA